MFENYDCFSSLTIRFQIVLTPDVKVNNFTYKMKSANSSHITKLLHWSSGTYCRKICLYNFCDNLSILISLPIRKSSFMFKQLD